MSSDSARAWARVLDLNAEAGEASDPGGLAVFRGRVVGDRLLVGILKIDDRAGDGIERPRKRTNGGLKMRLGGGVRERHGGLQRWRVVRGVDDSEHRHDRADSQTINPHVFC